MKARSEGMVALSLWALSFAKRRRGALATLSIAMVLKIGLDVLRPWPLKWLVDHVLLGKPLPRGLANATAVLPGADSPQGLLTWLVAATVVLFLLGWTLGAVTAWANVSFASRMVYDLASTLFGHLQRLSLRFHARRPIGDFIRRVTSDCGCVAVIVKDALLPVATAVISLVAMIGVMGALNPPLTLLAIAVAPGMALVIRRYAAPMLERSYRQQEVEGRTYTLVEQTLSSIPVVQAYGREDEVDRRFRRTTEEAVSAALEAANIQLKFKIGTGIMTALGTAAILWVGAHEVLAGRLSIGSILVFLSYLGSLYAPLESLMYSSSTLQSAAGSARRVRELLGTEREVTDRPGAVALARVHGDVALEHVTFGYEEGRPVLRDVSIAVTAGSVVALVGPTGAGKTTLVGLVPRLFDPWEGRVLVDGKDVRDVSLAALRRNVAMVLQEPFLFPVTIAENIAYGRPAATRAEIESAARAAGAHAFVERLPEGYDTVVGERGATLSGGERQRISIARAFLKDAPILVLDEPTSALDAVTEASLLEATRRLMHGRTTLVIAHRMGIAQEADRVVVLEEGRVVEDGAPAVLARTDGPYRRLLRTSFGVPDAPDTGRTGTG